MVFLDSTANGIRPFLQIFLLFRLLIQLQCVSGEVLEPPKKECTQDLFANNTGCIHPGTYYLKQSGEGCRITVNSTKGRCTRRESTRKMNPAGVKSRGQMGRKVGTSASQDKCTSRTNQVNFTSEPSWEHCSKYVVSPCETNLGVLKIHMAGDKLEVPVWGDNHKNCYDVSINDVMTTNYDISSYDWCPGNVLTLWLDVDKALTVLTLEAYQPPEYEYFQLNENKQFNMNICSNRCPQVDSVPYNVTSLTFYNFGGSCTDEETKKAYTNCTHYNGTSPTKCWQRGCQYSKETDKCFTGKYSCNIRDDYPTCICSNNFCEKKFFNDTGDCADEDAIFGVRLSCWRADTYYVYHPKILCYNQDAGGYCDEYRGVYSVNLGGGKLRDYNDIDYIADQYSNYRDPNNTRRIETACKNIDGVRHKPSIDLYASTYVGDGAKDQSRDGACIYYPIPFCQNGEYMLTIKLVEPLYNMTNSRCTEVRINDVPVMMHMDTFTLAKNRTCGIADVVLRFLAKGGDESNPKSNYQLHIEGHVEPINVIGGEMDLQFCIGNECTNDPHPVVSAFSLERYLSNSKVCNQSQPLTEQL